MNSFKTLDRKLEEIRADPAGSDSFIIADAKDADMAFGIRAPGPSRNCSRFSQSESVACYRTLEEFRQQIRDVTSQGIIDIMLLSASSLEQLATREGLFRNSGVTPAARANDTTDIWAVRGGKYPELPSRSFRTATIEHIKYGRLDCDHEAPATGAELGLYSITFTNNIDWDHRALEEFHEFRNEAERKHFRYFLEVFNPNVDPGIPQRDVYKFLNDHIVRCLAGVTSRGRPLFLKIPYNGPHALEELASYDPALIVGILGGSAGTSHDAFKLIAQARKHGARAALFGRKINLSEHPLSFIEILKRIVDGDLSPGEAVKAYHSILRHLKIRPHRPLNRDMELTETALRYG